jgi:hypothetical protein
MIKRLPSRSVIILLLGRNRAINVNKGEFPWEK